MVADEDLPRLDSWQRPPARLLGQQADLSQAALQIGGTGADQQHIRSILAYRLPVNVLCRVASLLYNVSGPRQFYEV